MTAKLKPEGEVRKCDADGLRGGFSKQREKHGLLVMNSSFKFYILFQIHSNDKYVIDVLVL